MLCEDCHARKATIHVAVFSWPAGELNKHLCESCYEAVEAARTMSYADQPATLPPEDVEHITAEEYLRLSARASANGIDKPAFKAVSQQLERLPDTRARLGLELLRVAWKSLEQGDDPYHLIGLGGCFMNSTNIANPTHEFLELLEKIITRSIERMSESPKLPSAHPFGFGLTLAVIGLRRANPDRCAAVIGKLRDRARGQTDRWGLIVDYVEERIAKSGRKQSRKKPRKE